MQIIVGSKNPAKIDAVTSVFSDTAIASKSTESNVSAQPFSDEETMRGAINRAKQCANEPTGTIGIGLEGGVMYIEEALYLCNWGALAISEDKIYTASGARIILPNEIAKKLKNGAELGDVMAEYTKKLDVRQKEGAIGIFTNELVSRKEMFTHVVRLLRGQMEFHQEQH
ncbi:DUF84 family protein [Virgibacillus halophilus]|uniref:DUF84 family protein n=1 Tax=Tigheibacillus halophilus TaxID=361280 RepID=UPI0036424131